MKRFLIIITVLALLVPGVLLAQDEVTLKDVSTSIADLAEQVAALVTRVEAVEELFADPWSPDLIDIDDGICQSPLHTSAEWFALMIAKVHQETADAYRAEYGISIKPSDPNLASISFATEGNEVYLQYAMSGSKVVETWANCEYIGHSEWEKE